MRAFTIGAALALSIASVYTPAFAQDDPAARIAELEAQVAAQAETIGTLGTPIYMAPEQVTGGHIDERTDIYAIGVLFYELLVGRPPFLGRTAMATAMARLQEPPPDPRESAPSVPDRLAALVLRCLEREPEGRPASAGEVAEELERCLEGAPAAGGEP